jgi:hypothetical protein
MLSKMLSLKDVKDEPFFIEHILWDLDPAEMLEPRVLITAEGAKAKESIKGYVFYIDTMDTKPILFLMRHTAADYAETIAQIDEIPQDFLAEAVDENKGSMRFGMCRINKKVEDWLKKELGVL